MKNLTHKMAQFFNGEDFAEHGDDARLELTPAELRQISNLMRENARLKTNINIIYNELQQTITDFKAAPDNDCEEGWLSDGEWLDVFYELCVKIQNSLTTT